MFIILFVLLFVVLQIWQWLLICQWFAMMLTPMTFWLGNCAVLPNSNIALLIKPSRASSALKSANEQPTLRFVTEFPVSSWQYDFVKCFSPVHSAEEPFDLYVGQGVIRRIWMICITFAHSLWILSHFQTDFQLFARLWLSHILKCTVGKVEFAICEAWMVTLILLEKWAGLTL